MGRRGRRSSVEWARLVDEFRDSGLTQAEFAHARGLNVGTFRQRLYTRRAGAGTGGGVLGAGRFVEVSVAQTPTVVGTGCRVRVGDVEMELASLPSAGWLRSLAGLETKC
jgi:hypothetical protein